MFCTKCGYKNRVSVKFCTQCGTNVNQKANMPQRQINAAYNTAHVNNNFQLQAIPRQEPQQAANGSTNKEYSIKWIIIGLPIILIVPFIHAWLMTSFFGLPQRGFVTALIFINFIFNAVFGFLTIRWRNLINWEWIPLSSTTILLYIIVMWPELPQDVEGWVGALFYLGPRLFIVGVPSFIFAVLISAPILHGIGWLQYYSDSAKQKESQEHEEEK